MVHRPPILLAIQSQYGGHLARALVYREVLADRFTVHIATVGRPPAPWFVDAVAQPVRSFPGPAMAEDARGQISFSRTIYSYARNLRQFWTSSTQIAEFVLQLQPCLVISDFEPRISSFCQRYRVPLVTIDAHRRFYLKDCPRPTPASPARLREYLGLQAAMLLMHRTGDLNIALSLFPIATRSREATAVLPPLIRAAVLDINATPGDHLLVYHNSGGERDDILAQCQGIPTIVYGYDVDETLGSVRFKRSSAQEFVRDLAECRAYASRAGFESVAEALYLGKPCYLVPQGRQYEQRVNAMHAAGLGARIADRFDYAVAYANRRSTRLDRGWVRSARERFMELIAEFADPFIP
jgi:uncharacterized protein (TIGR00661 family)